MRDWQHDWRTDIGLRLGGATLCTLSYLAIRGLIALRLPETHAEPGMEAYALAAAAFLCASMGAILLTNGHHLFDQVEVSQRWRTKLPAEMETKRPLEVAAPADADHSSSYFFIVQDNQNGRNAVRRP